MGEKQYDPVMHSAEHLVNGTIDRMCGCGRAFSSHIEKKKSKCDYHFSRNLTDAELREVERRVNEQIAHDLKIYDELLGVEQAGKLYDLSRLPQMSHQVRIVHIGCYDAAPCIGSHVASTAQIPPVVVISSDWKEGVLRVRFKLDKRIE